MPATFFAGRPQDPKYADFTQRVADVLMESASRASVASRGAANVRLPQDKGSLEHAFAALFEGNGTRARQMRLAFSRSPRPRNRILASVNYMDTKSVAEQAVSAGLFGPALFTPADWSQPASQDVAEALLDTFRFRALPRRAGTGASPGAGLPAPRNARELHLKIKSVHCVQQVGWEATDWDLKDSMHFGGVGFDSTLVVTPDLGADSPNTAHFRKVPKFHIGTFPSNGSTHDFTPGKTFCKWPLDPSGVWPRSYFGLVGLAEQDSGDDFPEFLKAMWDLLGPAIVTAVSFLAGAWLGGEAGVAIGSLIGTAITPGVGTALGAAIGAAVGLALGGAIAFLADTLRDDILKTSDEPVVAVLESPARFADGGGGTSDVYTAEYVRPGMPGIYLVNYYWQLVH